MPGVPESLIRRVERLEDVCRRQQELLDSVGGREALVTENRWVYLAKTIKVGSTYPTSGNTFGLQFIDREFTPTEGTQSATDHTRSATSQAVGRTFDGNYIPAGTPVLAVPAPAAPGTSGKGRWHIVSIGGELHRGITAGANNKGSHGNVTRYIDGTNTSSVTDDVFNDFINVISGKVVIYAKIGSKYYLIAVECPPM